MLKYCLAVGFYFFKILASNDDKMENVLFIIDKLFSRRGRKKILYWRTTLIVQFLSANVLATFGDQWEFQSHKQIREECQASFHQLNIASLEFLSVDFDQIL